jgi:transcriptional regulator with XRE-family HTH domain
MKLSELTTHKENHRIYQSTDLTDLKTSLSSFGQMEPLAITTDNRIISGHRRMAAMQELEWTDCDVRIVEPDNEIVALIEHNRHRQKTSSDIINEARYLEKELRDIVGRGRNASKGRKDKNQGHRIKMVNELAQRLGVGTSRLKQLLSISNYEPELIERIDKGDLSVSAAYQIVQTNHIQKKTTSEPHSDFRRTFSNLIKTHQPPLTEVMASLKRTYPYSLEMTGLDEDRRTELVEHLERMRTMDSRSLMLVQKQDELEHLDVSPKEIASAKSLLPTSDELNSFWNGENPISKVRLVVADGKYDCPKSKLNLSKQLWNILRVSIHSQEHLDGPGRRMSSFVGFENENGFRLLGIVSFRSDSHSLKVRDDHIAWTTSQRVKNREHLVNMNVCCPTQPFGHDRLGGKFISLIAEKMVEEWERHYETRIVAIMTTSLHGPQSQYNGMRWWKSLGVSSGAMVLKPLRDEWSFWRNWLKENYPDTYDEVNNKTSPTQGMLTAVCRFLGIPLKEYAHNHQRGVYLYPIYSNYAEFLTDTIGEDDLIEKERDWHDWWLRKSNARMVKLTKEERLLNEPLFHEDIDPDELAMWVSVRGVG